MRYVIEKTSNEPAYLQLYRQVREDIVQQVYPLGSKLPSKRLIAAETGVSTITVEHAYALLCDEGYAESRERSVRILILNERENDLKEFRLPQGFEYTEVLLDGVKKSLSYNNYYDFLEEGHYELQWENSRIDQIFTTEFTLDLTAPTLDLSEVRNGAASGKVSFTDMEEGEYVRWIRDSKEEGRIEDPSEVLSKKGNYVLRVYDQAGNYTEYAFTLEGYFDINAILAILFVIALIGGGFFYCRRLRNNMRVG